ncbi:MAG: sugar ABC transporter substrate-binding protein [Clostridiales bacterium]|nr:sugar ABC transporter substrate-binding protein [Clostridiales bacterium]
MKKALLLSLVLILIAGLFVGCGSSKTATKNNKVTIRFWQAGGDDKASIPKMKEIIKKFENENKDIEVEFQATPWSENPHDKFSTSIAGGNIADLLIVGSPFDTVLANNGAVISLDQYIDSSFKSDMMETFLNQSVYEGKRAEINKKIISLPIYGSTRTIIYNKDLLKAENIPEPVDKGWSMDDFKKYALALTKDTNGDGVIDQYGFGTSAKYTSQFLPFIWDLGGEICNADITKATTTTPEWKEGISYFVDLIKKASPPGSVNLDLQEIQKLFSQGKVAIMIDAMDFANKIINEPSIKDKVGIGQMPIGKKQTSFAGADVFVITKQSKHPAEAWKLLRFILNTDNESEYCKTVGFMPVLKSSARDPYFTGDIVRKGYSQALTYGKFYVKSDKSSAVTTILKAEVQNIIGNKKTVDKALTDIQNQVNTALAQ